MSAKQQQLAHSSSDVETTFCLMLPVQATGLSAEATDVVARLRSFGVVISLHNSMFSGSNTMIIVLCSIRDSKLKSLLRNQDGPALPLLHDAIKAEAFANGVEISHDPRYCLFSPYAHLKAPYNIHHASLFAPLEDSIRLQMLYHVLQNKDIGGGMDLLVKRGLVVDYFPLHMEDKRSRCLRNAFRGKRDYNSTNVGTSNAAKVSCLQISFPSHKTVARVLKRYLGGVWCISHCFWSIYLPACMLLLVPIAAFDAAFPSLAFFALSLPLWGVNLLHFWRRKEHYLALEWGMKGSAAKKAAWWETPSRNSSSEELSSFFEGAKECASFVEPNAWIILTSIPLNLQRKRIVESWLKFSFFLLLQIALMSVLVLAESFAFAKEKEAGCYLSAISLSILAWGLEHPMVRVARKVTEAESLRSKRDHMSSLFAKIAIHATISWLLSPLFAAALNHRLTGSYGPHGDLKSSVALRATIMFLLRVALDNTAILNRFYKSSRRRMGNNVTSESASDTTPITTDDERNLDPQSMLARQVEKDFLTQGRVRSLEEMAKSISLCTRFGFCLFFSGLSTVIPVCSLLLGILRYYSATYIQLYQELRVWHRYSEEATIGHDVLSFIEVLLGMSLIINPVITSFLFSGSVIPIFVCEGFVAIYWQVLKLIFPEEPLDVLVQNQRQQHISKALFSSSSSSTSNYNSFSLNSPTDTYGKKAEKERRFSNINSKHVAVTSTPPPPPPPPLPHPQAKSQKSRAGTVTSKLAGVWPLFSNKN